MTLTAPLAAFPPQRILRNALAGAVVGVIALPLSIALAIAVGAEPIAGLYTAIFAGPVASLTGGSRYNITGPTAALVPLLHAVVLRHGPGALPLVGIMAGVLLLALSRLRVGQLVRFVPGPVLVGFTAGIAASIAFGQLNSLLGLRGTDPRLEHFAERAWDTITHLGTMVPATPLLALVCVVALAGWQRARIRVPGALVVVAAATVATGLWAWRP